MGAGAAAKTPDQSRLLLGLAIARSFGAQISAASALGIPAGRVAGFQIYEGQPYSATMTLRDLIETDDDFVAIFANDERESVSMAICALPDLSDVDSASIGEAFLVFGTLKAFWGDAILLDQCKISS